MAGVNKVIIVGNLGKAPELRHTQNGTAVANLSVATAYKPKDGEEQTEWHRVTVWGKTAEHCARYLTKGRQVYVEGRLQTRKYTDKEGIERRATEIVADTVQFLGGKGEQRDPEPAPDYTPSAPGDDDIPF